ncbi:BnaA01g27980D [Brassica napus]|uniref:BnaA01g27980D protein n=1 Tax=Brassica napus TaxID=3708 RepID=A0A078ICC1_BRANA|nr:BnaA01g27980D [Brassica napus]
MSYTRVPPTSQLILLYSQVPPTSIKQLRLTCKRCFSFHELFHSQVIKLTGILKSLKDLEDVKVSKIFHCKGYENKKKSGYNYKILSCSYYYRGSSRKLALLCQYSDSTGSLKMKIWLTNSKTDEAKDLSWSEFLVCKVVIYDMTRMKSFLVDEENKKVLCCYKDHEYRTRIYIVGEDTYKNVYREVLQEQRSRVAPRLFSYVPSLVQIPTSQSNPFCKRKR